MGRFIKTFAPEGLYPAVGNSQAENWTTDRFSHGSAYVWKKMQLPQSRNGCLPACNFSEDADLLQSSFAYVKWQRQHGRLWLFTILARVSTVSGHYFFVTSCQSNPREWTLVSSWCLIVLEPYMEKILMLCSFAFAVSYYYVFPSVFRLKRPSFAEFR